MTKTTLRKFLETKKDEVYHELDELRENLITSEISLTEFQELNSSIEKRLDLILDIIEICNERKHY